jgi:hypothetical protein
LLYGSSLQKFIPCGPTVSPIDRSQRTALN